MENANCYLAPKDGHKKTEKEVGPGIADKAVLFYCRLLMFNFNLALPAEKETTKNEWRKKD